ncbi:ABC transporter ATP-binding protein [Paenibacillus sp. SI8]|uniref:ABC transporter ATP-binding protein n=1 Tax=unclassified Paenibacillus TaxID=185978 RepID=UPI00346724B4
MQASEIILSVENISKTFKSEANTVNALKKVSLNLHVGEILSIMGTSGSGKSTLLNILGSLDEPDEGVIRLNGIIQKDIFEEPGASLYRANRIGFVFQNYNLLKDLTVEENVELPLILKGISHSSRVDEIIELVGLSKWKKHRPVQLSGGQQQRVAIARALVTNPPIVLADEPTGNLDYNTSVEILRILMLAKDKLKQSIILVTHDPMVASYADRVLFFHDGKIIDNYNCSQKLNNIDEIITKFKKILENK